MKTPPSSTTLISQITWMNYWTEPLWNLRFEAQRPIQVDISKFAEDIVAYGYENIHSDSITELIRALQAHMDKRSSAIFARLNTRSPKDFTESPLRTGQEIVDAISQSMRTTDDIMRLHKHKQPIILYLTPWDNAIRKREYRCFVKDGAVIGITQYNAYLENDIQAITNAIMHVTNQVIKAVPLTQFVIDVWIDDLDIPHFLEINPYGLSDPCLFGTYDILEMTPAVAYYDRKFSPF